MAYEFAKLEEKTTFEIDSFIFVPSNLGVNKDSYSRENFYSDMQVYIRFKTPSFRIEELAKPENELLISLKKSMEKMVSSQSSSDAIECENFLKLYCCIVKSSLRDHIDCLYAKKNVQDEEILLNKFLSGAASISSAFRKLREIVSIPNLNERRFLIYCFSDEYLSLLIEQYAFKAIHIISKRVSTNVSQIKSLKELIKLEIKYRTENKYPSIVKKEDNNENFLFRFSVLKKFRSCPRITFFAVLFGCLPVPLSGRLKGVNNGFFSASHRGLLLSE